MGIVVDLIIIGIIVLSTFLAYQKGLVKLAIGLCAFAISIVVTVILYQPISNLVIHVTAIDETIENAIYEKANEVMQNEQNKAANQVIETTKNEMLPQTARTLAVNIVRGGVMIVLFIAIRIALRFITALADAVAKLPILTQLNKTGGIIYGLARGLLIIYIALLILGIPRQINPNNTVTTSIDQSFLGKTMEENNLLNVFF